MDGSERTSCRRPRSSRSCSCADACEFGMQRIGGEIAAFTSRCAATRDVGHHMTGRARVRSAFSSASVSCYHDQPTFSTNTRMGAENTRHSTRSRRDTELEHFRSGRWHHVQRLGDHGRPRRSRRTEPWKVPSSIGSSRCDPVGRGAEPRSPSRWPSATPCRLLPRSAVFQDIVIGD